MRTLASGRLEAATAMRLRSVVVGHRRSPGHQVRRATRPAVPARDGAWTRVQLFQPRERATRRRWRRRCPAFGLSSRDRSHSAETPPPYFSSAAAIHLIAALRAILHPVARRRQSVALLTLLEDHSMYSGSIARRRCGLSNSGRS